MTSQSVQTLFVFFCCFLLSSTSYAQTCQERCLASYRSCASAQAAGCSLAGAAAQKAADQLLSRVPMGSFLSGAVKKGSQEACKAKLLPCQKVRDQCLVNECGQTAGAGSTFSGRTPKAAAKGTVRIFSDTPRSIVYINGQRMGATPKDKMNPFVSPEMTVGEYWVQVVSQDKKRSWSGQKTIKKGNINAIEATLSSKEKQDYQTFTTMVKGGNLVEAQKMGIAFLQSYPKSKYKSDIGQQLSDINKQIAAAEASLLNEINRTQDSASKKSLIMLYIARFPNGKEVKKWTAKLQNQESLTRLQKAAEKIKAQKTNVGMIEQRWKLGLEIKSFINDPQNASLVDEAKEIGVQHQAWHDPSTHTFEQIWKLEKNQVNERAVGYLVVGIMTGVIGGTLMSGVIPVGDVEVLDIFIPSMGIANLGVSGAFLLLYPNAKKKARKKIRDKYDLK